MFRKEWNNHLTLRKIWFKLKYMRPFFLFCFRYSDKDEDELEFYWNEYKFYMYYSKDTKECHVRSFNLNGESPSVLYNSQ